MQAREKEEAQEHQDEKNKNKAGNGALPRKRGSLTFRGFSFDFWSGHETKADCPYGQAPHT